MHEQAVGPAVKHAVEPKCRAAAQAATVVMAGSVESCVQSGLDTPVIDIRFEPLRRRQFMFGPTGDQFDRFRRLAFSFPMHPRGLRDQRKAGEFSVEVACHQGAYYQASFFQISPAHRRRVFQRVKKGDPGSGTCACTIDCTVG